MSGTGHSGRLPAPPMRLHNAGMLIRLATLCFFLVGHPLIMRRFLVRGIACGHGFRERPDVFGEPFAKRLQLVYLFLLAVDSLVQLLDSIFLLGELDFDIHQTILGHHFRFLHDSIGCVCSDEVTRQAGHHRFSN